MSATAFGTNDPLTNKAWAKKLAAEGIQKTYAKKFMGKEGEDALIMRKTELQKGQGDTITCALNVELTGEGREGDAVLKGHEESLEFHNQKIQINQLRHAVYNLEGMTAQRIPFNLRKVGKNRLSTWFADRIDTVFFNHLCGYTVETNGVYTGHNPTTAPTSARHFKANGKDNEEDLVAADKFSLEMIDYAVEKARTAKIVDGTGSPITPIMINGEKHYVCFIHEYQLTDLRTQAGGRWRQIHDALLSASTTSKNPVLSGAAGIYNNTILHAASRITPGVRSDTGAKLDSVRRAVFCGAGAAVMAYGGSEGKETTYQWAEETDDYGNQASCAAAKIWGFKKSVYSPKSGASQDHATIVLASHATAHNGS